jgi:hypothetical protein
LFDGPPVSQERPELHHDTAHQWQRDIAASKELVQTQLLGESKTLQVRINAIETFMEFMKEAIRREIAYQQDLIQRQHGDLREMLSERYATQTKALDAAFIAQQTAMRTALEAAEKAVGTALVSAEKAVGKAEVAAEKRFEAVNEFRGQLADQAATFLSRAEADIRITSLSEKLDLETKRAEVRVNDLELRFSSRLDIIQGVTQGTSNSVVGSRDRTAQMVAWIGLVVAIGALAAAIVMTFKHV